MRKLTVLLALMLAAPLLFACSDRESDDDNDADPSATVTPTAIPNTATPTPTATPRPGKELAEQLAQSPEFFIYRFGNGDTLPFIADMFDGDPDAADEAFLEDIKEVNQLTATGSLPTGYELAIPLRLPDENSLFQANSVAAVLSSGEDGVTEILVPGEALVGVLQGRVTLYRLQIENGDAPGEGHGFYAEYASTDRLAIKGGELDQEAQITGPAFITAGGSLAEQLSTEHPDAYVFRRSTKTYVVAVLGPGLPDGASIGAGIVAPTP